MKTQLLIAVAGLGLSLFTLGCGGDAPDFYQLKGMVTYDGKPLPTGEIIFSPDGTKGNKGPQGRAKIIDGVFDTSAEGSKGVVGGAYQVTINGFDGNADPAAELPLGKPLFQEYQVNQDLPPYSEVKGDSFNVDFEVPKDTQKKKPANQGV
ncbi:MAG: hypothetical protein KDA84_26510 [Planctomycetaceae bacterium]|nr:hypothetical protein [Planctomycetaceae bacterium]